MLNTNIKKKSIGIIFFCVIGILIWNSISHILEKP